MPSSRYAHNLQYLVMHGLRIKIIKRLILILPQIDPAHIASNVSYKNTFSILQLNHLRNQTKQHKA